MRSSRHLLNHEPSTTKRNLFKRFDWLLGVLVTLFTLVIVWKIIVTPFAIDFSVMLTFLLCIFTISVSILYYMKVGQTLQLLNQKIRKVESILKKDGSTRPGFTQDEEDIIPVDYEKAIREASAQIELEEKTLIIKEEERKKILKQLLKDADLDEVKKQEYLNRIEEVDHDLLNVRSNLAQLRKKINQSLSDIFILEKTKQIRAVVENLTPQFIVERSFEEINERYQRLQRELPAETVQFLHDNGYVNENGLNRKGYKEFTRMARKSLSLDE